MAELQQVPLFVVAHPAFSERYRSITAQLVRLQMEYSCVGIVGAELGEEEIRLHNRDWNLGQIGCALSHLEAYRRMVKSNLPFALVVEDDAILPENLSVIVSECFPFLSPRDVISLYSPPLRPMAYSDRNAPVLSSGRLLAPIESLKTQGTVAYIIGREAAEGILRCNLPVRHLADHWSAFHKEGALGKVLLHYPMPVSVAHFDSTIGYDRGIRGVFNTLIRNFPPLRSTLLHRRESRMRRQKANIVVVDMPTFYDQEQNYP